MGSLPQAPATRREAGYVTVLSAVSGRSARELERRLGLSLGRLQQGYAIYVLTEGVGLGEFEWKDVTRHSDGWAVDPSTTFKGEIMRVPVNDLMRGRHLVNTASDQQSDQALARFKAGELAKINVRAGDQRIVKVIPALLSGTYPDSPYGDVPQWRLLARKAFRLLGQFVA